MFDLTPYNTFGLNVQANEGIIINNVSDLRRVQADKMIILGHGSDVLFTDDYEGTVLINNIKSLSITDLDDDLVEVKVGAGIVLDSLIETLLNQGIFGLENLSSIPGTVGAAPIQNVGAYGVEIGDCIKCVHTYDLQRHMEVDFDKDSCEFAYRSSYFKTHKERPLCITQVDFILSRKFKPVLKYKGLIEANPSNAMALREHIKKLREGKLPDPKLVGNAGSFFKNPVIDKQKAQELVEKYQNVPLYEIEDGYKIAAGWLIEQAQCKGITHGNVGTWEHQALVIVNRGGAYPHEIVALAKYIMAEVCRNFGIKLEPEVRTFGPKGELSWDKL